LVKSEVVISKALAAFLSFFTYNNSLATEIPILFLLECFLHSTIYEDLKKPSGELLETPKIS